MGMIVMMMMMGMIVMMMMMGMIVMMMMMGMIVMMMMMGMIVMMMMMGMIVMMMMMGMIVMMMMMVAVAMVMTMVIVGHTNIVWSVCQCKEGLLQALTLFIPSNYRGINLSDPSHFQCWGKKNQVPSQNKLEIKNGFFYTFKFCVNVAKCLFLIF